MQEHGVDSDTHDHALAMTVEEQVTVLDARLLAFESRVQCNLLVAIPIEAILKHEWSVMFACRLSMSDISMEASAKICF